MDLNKKHQLELAALERELSNSEAILKKGFLKFAVPRVLAFALFFTPLYALIESYSNSTPYWGGNWLMYLFVGIGIGFLNSTSEWYLWQWTRKKTEKKLAKKQQEQQPSS